MTSTTDRIIGAALVLIAERGISQVTMLEVASRAGVARQTLYNHYPDIDSIVAHALEQHNQESIDQLRSAVAVVQTPSERIEQLVRHIVQISTHGGHTIDSDHGLSPPHRATVDEFSEALDELITGILAAGRDDGSFRGDLDVPVDTVLVRHLLNGISNLVAISPDDAALITSSAKRTVLAALQ